MSTTVDNRLVNLGFDNKQFESGVKQSVSSLDTLKKSLDLDEQAKSLQNLANTGRSFSLGPIADGVQNIANRFSALGIIGMTVLQNLTNKVVELGNKMWRSITAPAKQGFSEYEVQMNAIQTIMANTASKGTTLQQVNDILDEMNTYADKTIYSFPEMAKNMGTFTAAGIDLQTSAAAIKGIANLAAVSGSNSQQAAVAMYQLSQALSSGTVKLMDWNSVVNAGMGGQVFQDALKETARVHGVAIDDMIKKEGSFRNTLQNGWLSSEILTETLSKFTGDLTAEQLKSMGYTEAQAAEILKLGVLANDAATKVKTLSQLRETMQEALQSGWAKTWQIIVGDFEEAKAFFTYLNDKLGGMVQASSDARNKIVQGWKDYGGREDFIDAIKNSFDALDIAIKPVKEALSEIFPKNEKYGPGFSLFLWTWRLKQFTEHLKMGGEAVGKVKTIFKGFFSILDIGRMAIVAVATPLGKFLKSLGGKVDKGGIVDYIVKVAQSIINLRDAIKTGDYFNKKIEEMKAKLEEFHQAFRIIMGTISLRFYGLKKSIDIFRENLKKAFEFKKVDTTPLSGFLDKLRERFDFKPLETLLKIVNLVFDGLTSLLEKSGPTLLKMASFIGKVLEKLGTAVMNAVANLDFNELFDLINSGLFGGLIVSLTRFVNSGSLQAISGMFGGIAGVLDEVRQSLQAFQENIRSKTLLNIALAVAVLAASLLVISLIDSERLTSSLGIVTTLFADLVLAVMSLNQATSVKGSLGVSTMLIGLSLSLILLTVALERIADMDENQIQKGLASLGIITTGIVAFMQLIGSNSKSFAKAALSILILSAGLLVIAEVVEKLGSIDIPTLQKGLAAIGIVLGELVAFTQLAGKKIGIGSGLGIIALAGAVLLMSLAVEKFGNMDIGVLKQGLITIGAVLTELGIFILLAGDGKKVLATAIGMAILGGAMLIFAEAITRIGNLSWDQISKGMAGIAGALLAIVLAVNLMPKNMIITAVGLLIIAGAIYILANSLTTMSQMSWEEIGKGLATLGGALLIISIGMYAMQGAFGGAAALLVVAGALAILTPVIKTLGSMGIKEIALALGALAAMFIILGVAGALLTPVVPTLLGLGVSIMLIGTAVALIGAGLLLFSSGLAALAVSGMAGAAAFVGIVGTLLGLIPMLVTAIVNAIILFAQLIIDAIPVIGEALLVLIQTLCTIIVEAVPSILIALTTLLEALWQLIRDQVPQAVDAILYILGELLKSIADKIPEFTQSAFDMLIGFLKGIRDNIAEVVIVTGEIVTAFLEALALELPKIIQAGFDLLISFIDGITLAIETNGETLTNSIGRLATAIITGLTDGLLGGIDTIVKAIGNIGSAIIDALKTLLGIASPSKVTEEMGVNVVKGLVNGILKNANSVSNATEKLGKKAVLGMTNAISRINDSLNNNLDINPVIRPVVDLSAVENSGKNINNIFGKRSIQLSGSMNNLSIAASRMSVQNGSAEQINKSPTQATTITFNQTNNSPKALSQFDIYRETRNQLLMLKGLVLTHD